ncbi:MAG: hypothetical protein WA211_08310 [Candidatus Acidiferrales bacterium]
MTNANGQSYVTTALAGTRFPEAGATLLILLGVLFQLGQLGYGHLGLGNLWFFSMMLTDIWNILSMRLNIPALGEVLRYWPLALVGLGFAILLATHENRASRARRGNRHGQ